MKSEIEELSRKLELAMTKLAAVETECLRLEGLMAPLRVQLADAQRERKYLKLRVEKLQGILAKQ